MAANAKISDEAVEMRTGKTWDRWFRALDRYGAAKKGHKTAARWLHEEHELSPWWSQTIVVRYELDRGLRKPHERPKGYEVSVTRRIEATAARAFDALTRPSDLSHWFTRGARANLEVGGAYSNGEGDRGRFLALVRPKRIRMTWDNQQHAPNTVVEFVVSSASSGKVQVAVTHSRLSSRRDAATMKEAWAWALDSLRSYLENGKAISVEAWEAARDAKKKTAARAKPKKKLRKTA